MNKKGYLNKVAKSALAVLAFGAVIFAGYLLYSAFFVSAGNISTCQTLSTANTVYTLTQNVSSNGTCFTITANGITLDGQGYKITYGINGTDDQYGVSTVANRTVINNLFIEEGNNSGGGRWAVSFKYSINVTIFNNTIRTNGSDSHGVRVYLEDQSQSQSNVTISMNTIITSDAIGIILFGNAVSSVFILKNNITTNTTSRVDHGIFLDSSTDNALINDNVITILGNDSYGINIQSSNNSVVNNTVTTSAPFAHGIYLFGTHNNTFLDNVITTISNNSAGIFFNGEASLNNFFNNTIVNASHSSSNDTQFNTGTSGTLNFTNVTLVNKKIGFSGTTTFLLNIHWYLDAYVNSTTGVAIPLANVTAQNISNATRFSLLTNATGSIERQAVLEYWRNASNTGYQNNYTLNVSKFGYNFINRSLNISTNQLAVFTLSPVNLTDCGTLDEPNRTYYLASNVSSNETCFTITAHNVTLNGQGFKITYGINGIANKYGVFIQGRNQSTVKNLLIVEGNNSGSKDAIVSVSGSHGIITNNTINTSGPGSDAISLSSGSNITLSFNNLTINGSGRGMKITDFSNLTTNKNTITAHGGGDGICLITSSFLSINNETILIRENITSLKNYGICLDTTSNSTFRNIFITTSKEKSPGIFISDGDIASGSAGNLFFDSQINSSFANDTELSIVNGVSAVNFTNVTLVNNRIGFISGSIAILNIHNYLEAIANYTNGTAASNANITARNTSGAITFSKLTNTTGRIPRQIVLERWINASNGGYQNNYSINASRPSQNLTQSVNVSTSQNLLFTFSSDTIIPNISFVSPTPANGTSTENTTFQINVSMGEHDLKEFIWNWNGTNYSFFNSSLTSLFNFDNISALGEGGSLAVDVGNSPKNGTITGAVFNSSGKYGGAYQFSSGSTDVISIARTITDTNFAYMAWIYQTANPTYDAKILSIEETGLVHLEFSYDTATDKIKCTFAESGPSYKTVFSSATLSNNIWTHVACFRNSTSIGIAMNGIFSNSTASTGPKASNTPTPYIGNNLEGNRAWVGLIDEVRMYASSLSNGSILQHSYSNLYKYGINSWSFITNQSNLSRGTYTYFAAATDTGNNQNITDTRTLIIADTTPPVVTINKPAGNSSTSSIDFNATLNENGTCRYTLNSGTTNYTMQSNGGFDFNATNNSIADGSYTARFYCNDSSNNLNSSTTRGFTIDTKFPTITINAPANNSNVTTNFTIFNWSVQDAGNNNEIWLWASNDSASLYDYLIYHRKNLANGTYTYNWSFPTVNPLASGLVALYHFDNLTERGENASIFNDSSKWDITEDTGYCATGCPTFVEQGIFAGALELGSSKSVYMHDSEELSASLEYTVMGWLNMSSAGTTVSSGGSGISVYPLVNKGIGEAETPTQNVYFFIGLNASNSLCNDYEDTASANHPVCGTPLNLNQWYFFTVVKNATSNVVYINGVQDGKINSAPNVTISTIHRIGIGVAHNSLNATSGVFNGQVDEIAFFNKSMTAAEAASFYNISLGRKYWRVNASDSLNMNSSGIYEFNLTMNATVDLVPPLVTINKPAGNSSASSVDFNATLNENGTCRYTLDSGVNNVTMQNNGNRDFNHTNSSIADGSYTTRFYCNDTSNNINSSETKAFSVDTLKPSVNITQPLNLTYNSNSSLSLNYTVGDTNLQLCFWSLDGGTNNTIACGLNTTLNISQGSHSVKVYANDTFGNLNGTSTVTFFTDSINPQVSYAGNADTDGRNYSRNWTFINVTVTEANFINITFKIFNSTSQVNVTTYTAQTFFINFTNLNDELYKFNVTVTDTANNRNTTATRIVRVDTTAPQVGYGVGTDNDGTNFTRNSIFANVTVNETNFANITFKLFNSGNSVINTTTYATQIFFINFTGLTNGTYRYNVTVTDGANTRTSAPTRTIGLDTEGPSVVIVEPKAQTYVTNMSLALNYSVSDAVAGLNSCWYGLDGGTNITLVCGTNATFNVSEGSHTMRVYANDTLGNLNSSSVAFSTSTTAPSVQLTSPQDNQWLNSTLNIYFNYTPTDAQGISMCRLYGNWTGSFSINQTNTSLANATSNFFTANLTAYANGNYLWNVECNDTSNNIAFAQGNFTIKFDTSLPQINYTSSTDTDGTNLSRNWIFVNVSVAEANEANITFTLYNSTSSYNETTFTTAVRSINWTGLADGSYTLNVSVVDYASNKNTTATRTITLDTTNPNATLISPVNGSFVSNATQNLTVNLSDNIGLRNATLYVYNSTDAEINQTTIGVSGTQKLLGIVYTFLYDGIFKWFYRAVDIAGNFFITGNSTITIDTIAPQINYTSSTDTDGTNLSRSWIFVNVSVAEANEANITFTLYNSTSSYNETTFTTAVRSINWTGLAEGTYTFNVSVIDSANTKNTTATRIVRIDITTPGITLVEPQNTTYTTNISLRLNYTLSETNLQACWYALDGGSNTTITCGQNTTINVSQGSHTARAYVNDTAGSQNSTSVTFFVDSVNPLVSYGSQTEADGTNLSRNWIFVNVTVTESNFANISFKMYSSTSLIDIVTYTSQTFFANFTALADDTYTYNVTVTDTINNQNTTSTRRITLDTTNPNATLISPANNSISNNATQNLTVNLSDNIGLKNATLYVYNSSDAEVNQTTIGVSGTQKLLGIVYTFLYDGIFKWFYRAVDIAGNFFITGNSTITIDATNPLIFGNRFESSQQNNSVAYNTGSVTFYANITETNVQSVVIEINLTANYENRTVSEYSEGSNGNRRYLYTLQQGQGVDNRENVSWIWYINDTAGNRNATSINSFTVTNRPPEKPYLNISNNTFIPVINISLRVDAYDPDSDNVSFFIYNTTSTNPSTAKLYFSINTSTNFTTFNATNLAEGKHYLYGVANDSTVPSSTLSNTSEAYLLTVDTINPTVTNITSPGSSTLCSLTGISLAYSVNDTNIDYCAYNITLSGSEIISTTNLGSCISTTFNVSSNGNYTVWVSVYDLAGNFNFSSKNFTVNASAPSCSSEGSAAAAGGGGAGGGGGGAGNKTKKTTSEKKDIIIEDLGDVVMKAGESKSLSATVTYEGNRSILNNCKFSGDGEFASWITSLTKEEDLSKGEIVEYLFTLKVPPDADPKDYGLGLKVKCLEEEETTSFKVTILKSDLIIQLLGVNKSGNNLEITYKVSSSTPELQKVTVNYWLSSQGKINISEGDDYIELEKGNPVTRKVILNVRGLPPGEYLLHIVGTSDIASFSIEESVLIPKAGTALGGIIFGENSGTAAIAAILVGSFVIFSILVIRRIVLKHRTAHGHEKTQRRGVVKVKLK